MDVLSTSELACGCIPQVERRGMPRHPCTLHTFVEPLGINHTGHWPARTHNLSSAGLGLVVARRFERGTLLLVNLCRPENRTSVTLVARVMRVVPLPGGWLLGCCFPQVMNADEFQGLLQQATEAPASRVRETVKHFSGDTRIDLRAVRERLKRLFHPQLCRESGARSSAVEEQRV